MLPHLPGYSGTHVTAAPGSWWEQLLDLDLDLDGAETRQKPKGQRLDLDGAQSKMQMLDLDGAQKEMLDLDGARKERPAVRDEYPGHTGGHSMHTEL